MAKVGRKPREFTPQDREEIEKLAGLALSLEQIAILKKCDIKTLKKNCSEEIEVGRAKAYQLATNQLFLAIKKGNLTGIIFYLKTQHGWRETNRTELTGANGVPLTPVIEIVKKV